MQFDYLIESACFQAAFYLIFYFGMKKDTHYEWNRGYLMITSMLSLLFPLLDYSQLPISEEVLSSFQLEEFIVGTTQIDLTQTSKLTINNCFSVIYILISGCFVIYFLYNLLKLVYFIIQNPQEKHDGYVVIFTKGKLPTSTFFNYLFWDDSQALEQQEKQQIIQHELAHIRGKHTLDMIWSELLKCIFWFNPLLWNWQKSLQEIHEFIADAQVVKNISVQSYKNLIVKHFFESVDLSMAINLRNGFRQSQIQKRLLMMVKPQTPSHMKAKSLLALPIAAGMMFFFACQENEQVESLKNETTTEKSMAKSEKETPEVNAEPVGGINQLFTWLGGELKYPEVARNNKVEGKVFVEFIVSEDGSIKDVKVLKGIGGGCDEEALRVISQMPKWKPALKDGKAVNQKLTLPITFKLS